MIRVLVCGSRHWDNRRAIKRELLAFPLDQLVVVHGACRGADLQAEAIAKQLEVPYEGYPARWKKQGRAAGPIRNQVMADTKPDFVFAFHENIDESSGTAGMMEIAKKAGIHVRLFEE